MLARGICSVDPERWMVQVAGRGWHAVREVVEGGVHIAASFAPPPQLSAKNGLLALSSAEGVFQAGDYILSAIAVAATPFLPCRVTV